MAEARKTFGPVVLLGLGSAALAAVAGSKPMAEVDGVWLDDRNLRAMVEAQFERAGGDELPLAGALALVLLATWGVLLVTRGRVRRAVAVVALASAAGVVAATLLGYSGLVDSMRDELAPLVGDRSQMNEIPIDHTAWFWTLLVAGLLGVLASAAAVRWAPEWPEMGTRYDAPTAGGGSATPVGEPQEQTNLDLWKSLDEGHDPTA